MFGITRYIQAFWTDVSDVSILATTRNAKISELLGIDPQRHVITLEYLDELEGVNLIAARSQLDFNSEDAIGGIVRNCSFPWRTHTRT